MPRVYGTLTGLKSSHLKRLERIYRRRIVPADLISPELSREVSGLSAELGRQVGLLINRQGKVTHVIVGTPQAILIPNLEEYRLAPGRLRGLRCVHTHLADEALSREDLTDLALLRLDLMAAIDVDANGFPARIHVAHILPSGAGEAPYDILPPLPPHAVDIGCLDRIQALEAEMAQLRTRRAAGDTAERALLVSVTGVPRRQALDRLAELRELARSAGIRIEDTVLQLRKQPDPRYLMGIGKLQELSILALQKGVTLIIFDQELNPSQIRSITDRVAIKVIDRTMLILDIFAQRAQSREGRRQVELAQLKYLLPRLVTKNTAMSRLTGGIGGRGPGETKLEINRRRVRDRIAKLESSLQQLKVQRRQQKARRAKRELPVISIIGYTNAGKSTLLNTLTHSDVIAENRLFATLDPSSRRMRFPRDLEVIITDTVGFIHNLPKDLVVAFRATLEELESADLLLHVIDISNPRFADQIRSVEQILTDLDLNRIPVLRVLNKMDRVDGDAVAAFCRRYEGVAVSALNRRSLPPLIDRIVERIGALSEVIPSGLTPREDRG